MSSSRYRILGKVGQGQFGKVLCASDRRTGSLVALKVLNKKDLPTRLFLRELRLLAGLQHPNIVSVQTIAYTAMERYLVMDYCEGGTLRDLLLHPIHLSLEQRLRIMIDVLKGLAYAHQRDVVHCDLKPENILLTHTAEGWSARISDFGIARLAEEAGVIGQGDTGSPAYMAPERFYGQYSFASDLYAIGVILFELLVGKRPFMGLPGELMAAHINEMAQIPKEVPFLLRSVLKTALQKLPQRRFKHTEEMLRAVELAASVLSTEDPTAFTLTSCHQMLTVTHSPVIEQEAWTSPLSCLFIQGNQVYVGSHRQVIGRTYPTPDLEPNRVTEQQWQFPQPVIDLFGAGGQTWACTLSNPADSPCFYSFGDALDPVPYPSPFNLTAAELSKEAIKIGRLPAQKWLAMSVNQSTFKTGETSEQHEQALLYLLRSQQMQPMGSPVPIHPPDWLFLLDQRYGVAISSGSNQSQFQGFTRRGTCLQPFSVPLSFQQIVQSVPNPYHLLAMATDFPQVGFLIDLMPWRLTRITFAIQPEHILATAWGYVLIAASQVLLLGLDGRPISQFRLPMATTEKITAMARTQPGFMIGTESDTSATLYTVDVRALLTHWQQQVEAQLLETTNNRMT
ncbi:serine/threonine-protein kinase [Acaryochloris sp. IP29b_bin.148]|uniref:serine/threonine-protein kinase n=1 Tax=Acaryochloris sp. IP29b_bin.148 TaxID=2969218 RepID=UPI002601C461|nr:serine/threonine-protein kinase [Acaryochloris sp. IP29b_bin.148]